MTLVPCVEPTGQTRYLVTYQGHSVSCLAVGSKIIKEVGVDYHGKPLPALSGVFVSDILVWTYEDTIRYDKEHGKNFSKNWCPEAKEQGFVYVVDFAGYARPNNGGM